MYFYLKKINNMNNNILCNSLLVCVDELNTIFIKKNIVKFFVMYYLKLNHNT